MASSGWSTNAGGREAAVIRTENIAARYAQLSPGDQAIVTAELRRILAERDQ
ncbi:hypothetical protein ACVWXQ_003588 [Bradyrhizobium sp. S3.14.4]